MYPIYSLACLLAAYLCDAFLRLAAASCPSIVSRAARWAVRAAVAGALLIGASRVVATHNNFGGVQEKTNYSCVLCVFIKWRVS